MRDSDDTHIIIFYGDHSGMYMQRLVIWKQYTKTNQITFPSDTGALLLLQPSPCLPNLKNLNGVGSLRLGKYSKWFNDVLSTNISDTCGDIVNELSQTHGCEVVEIVVPELLEMHTAHLVTMGTEMLRSISPYWEESGKGQKFTPDTRINIAIFESFTASDYVAAQCLRRRMMHHHMEIFKKVDVIVTPTTGITAPKITPSALKSGETNLPVTGYLMQFSVAANLLGFPAITIPVGYDKQGLPISVQFIGQPWGEASILHLASTVEELCARSRKRPASFFDVLKTT